MLTKDTLQALQESQSIATTAKVVAASDDTKELVFLPSDFKQHDLEQYLPNRRRARGTMETTVLASFADYTKAHKEDGCCVFVNADSMTASAVLNLGTPSAPGHADNRAKFSLQKTAAYRSLLSIANGAPYSQKVIAEFLEDWSDNITCINSDGALRTPLAIAAVRKITIESMSKRESEEQSLSATKSAFESVQATSKDPIPTLIQFRCQPYTELTGRCFDLRLGIMTSQKDPMLTLRIVKAEEHQEQMAAELVDLIEMAFEETIPVLIGGYSKL